MSKLTKPTCCNHGCESNVVYTRNGRPTAFCGSCTLANSTGNYKFGVFPIKIGRCYNYLGDIDLGFPCPTDYEIIESNSDTAYKRILELDHINGKPYDNRLKNLCPLCPVCHATKGSLNKDQNAWKNYIG
jgi:hypothetical protein